MKTRMEEKKMVTTTLYLPPELIIQILLRLPVKSLICFKSVCKSWFTIISNPNFANSNFQIAATQTRRIISISSTTPEEIQTIDFEALVNNHAASLSLNIPHSRTDFPLQIRGSCRGFLFLTDRLKLYLWNRSSRFHKQIPLSCDSLSLSFLYGFGYDRSTDDYVVVSMCYDRNTACSTSHLEFFSLRDNMWKEIEGTHFPYERRSFGGYDNGGTIHNEAIHWLAFRRDLLRDVIVAFDLMERKLLAMLPPIEIEVTLPINSGLWVFGEFLSLWAMRVGRVEIWVMKEYQVPWSWTKNIVLSTDTLPTNYFRPIYSTKNDDVVGTDGGHGLVKYNDKGQLLEYRSYYNNLIGPQVTMYIESLLSLPGDC